MPLFRKLPVVIEAMQVPILNDTYNQETFEMWGRLVEFLGLERHWHVNEQKGVDIVTLEGTMTANPGDWIIRGVKNELYPCKPDIFAATYEPAPQE
jgi:hypothetical protein